MNDHKLAQTSECLLIKYWAEIEKRDFWPSDDRPPIRKYYMLTQVLKVTSHFSLKDGLVELCRLPPIQSHTTGVFEWLPPFVWILDGLLESLPGCRADFDVWKDVDIIKVIFTFVFFSSKKTYFFSKVSVFGQVFAFYRYYGFSI